MRLIISACVAIGAVASPTQFLPGQSRDSPFARVPVQAGKQIMRIDDSMFESYMDQKYGDFAKTIKRASEEGVPILDLCTERLPDDTFVHELGVPNREFIVTLVDSRLAQLYSSVNTPPEHRAAQRSRKFTAKILNDMFIQKTETSDNLSLTASENNALMRKQIDRYRLKLANEYISAEANLAFAKLLKDTKKAAKLAEDVKRLKSRVDVEQDPIIKVEANRARYIAQVKAHFEEHGILSFHNADKICLVNATIVAISNLDRFDEITLKGGELGQKLLALQNPDDLFQDLSEIRKLMGYKFCYRKGEMACLSLETQSLMALFEKLPNFRALSQSRYIARDGKTVETDMFKILATKDTSLNAWLDQTVSYFQKPSDVLIFRIPDWFRWLESPETVDTQSATSKLPSGFPTKPLIDVPELLSVKTANSQTVQYRLKSTIVLDRDALHAHATVYKHNKWWMSSDGDRRPINSFVSPNTSILFYQRV